MNYETNAAKLKELIRHGFTTYVKRVFLRNAEKKCFKRFYVVELYHTLQRENKHFFRINQQQALDIFGEYIMTLKEDDLVIMN